MTLSILVPVHTSHIDKFYVLFEYLKKQVKGINAEAIVEILYEVDSGQISTGAKRNVLLHKAKGDYVVMIDADDWVAETYVSEILKAISIRVDCVSIKGWMTTDGGQYIEWHLAKDNENKTITVNNKPFYLRKTNHLCPVRRELAIIHGFSERYFGEDKDFSEALNPYLKTETSIEIPLYHYRFSSKDKLYK